MKKLIFFTFILFFLNSCLYTIAKRDIETPFDTVRTLQWALNKIDKNDFFYIMDELFTEDGNKIVEQLRKLEQSKKQEEQKLWKKIQEVFKNIIIRLDNLNVTGKTALVLCTYFFPENYFITHVKVQMIKDSDGWKITKIENFLSAANPQPTGSSPPAGTGNRPAAPVQNNPASR